MPFDDLPDRNVIEKVVHGFFRMLAAPGHWFREKVVEPNRPDYPWYHERYRRVPTIDECYTDDKVCWVEADTQYKRDRLVDTSILTILRLRMEDCAVYEQPDSREKCKPIIDQYKQAETNWFMKYGDLGYYHNVERAYMKQKHRMVWERRHGPVGSGMRTNEENSAEEMRNLHKAEEIHTKENAPLTYQLCDAHA